MYRHPKENYRLPQEFYSEYIRVSKARLNGIH
jgi:hypothetical protein